MRFFSSLVRPDESTGAVMRWVHRIWVFFWLTVLGAGIGLLSLYLTAHSYASIDATALLQSYFKIPLLVMMNLLAPILLVYLGFFLFARPWAAYLLSALPFFTLALASYYKVQLRGDPVLATDLRLIRTAGGIMGNYTFEISAPVIVVLEGFVLMLVLSCLMLRKERMSPRSRLAGIMLMLSVTLACYFELYTSSSIYKETANNDLISPWSAVEVYISRGTTYPFLHSVQDMFPEPPEGYRESEAKQTLEQYADTDIPDEQKITVVGIMLEAFSDLSDFAQENFSGIAVIKAFVKEYKELQAFRKLNKENEEINVTYTKIATLLEVLVTLFVESVVCIILGYGGYLVYQGRFNAGQLVEYIGYFEAIVWPIMAVSMLIEKTSRGRASLNRITELLDAPIDVADRPGVADLTDPKGGIEFRHLNFRYPDGEYDVLQDISFRVEPGESVGIVGKTGAGKTALVDLLLRTYNVPDGTLFVDGRDVNSLSIHSVRNACAYVPQDNFLFSDTIAHNIAFGVDDATPEDIERAASMADVRDNIVDFKDGYETVLGERGVTVSGGQKQRISIARALLKDAPILILDDSVSAVDTSTEKIILDNLKNSRAGKTTLLIAHRISTVERLDKIVFLNEGRVEAVGPHDQLYASCPEYRRMVDLQRLEDETTKGGQNA